MKALGLAIEELIKITAMYGLSTQGSLAKFIGAVIAEDKDVANVHWMRMSDVRRHLDDVDCEEIEGWLTSIVK
jgi:hypothetical protein